jgi:putative hydrolase
MRPHFLGLVEQMLDAVDPDPKRFFDALGRAAEAFKSGRNPLADGGVMALVASDEQRAVLDQVSGLMSLLEGHGDITMDRAGAGLIPSADRFGRVLRQRRQSAQGLARLLQQLIGLEAKLAQYEQGERFIEQVEAAGDRELLAMAWDRPENLPSIAEIRDPSAWLARVTSARVA